jgi:hypothetical protein
LLRRMSATPGSAKAVDVVHSMLKTRELANHALSVDFDIPTPHKRK